MKKTLIFFFTTLLCFNVILKSQTLQYSSANSNVENAQYLKEDLTKLLQKNIKYPIEALKNKIQGDVILSINIDKNGNMNSLNIISSPSEILSSSSLASFNHVENEWSPCKVNGNPVSKNYLIVFRYKFYLNTQPPEYKKRAEKFVKKQKYEKALKYYNNAITENQFNYELFESRSKLNKILGDTEGAKNDSQQSDRLKNKIISLVDIAAIGQTRVEKRVIY